MAKLLGAKAAQAAQQKDAMDRSRWEWSAIKAEGLRENHKGLWAFWEGAPAVVIAAAGLGASPDILERALLGLGGFVVGLALSYASMRGFYFATAGVAQRKALGQAVADLQRVAKATPTPGIVAVKLRTLRLVENEIRENLNRARGLVASPKWPSSFKTKSDSWRMMQRGAFSGVPEWQALYDLLRDTYEAVQNVTPQPTAKFGTPPNFNELWDNYVRDVEGVIPQLEKAHEALQAEIRLLSERAP